LLEIPGRTAASCVCPGLNGFRLYRVRPSLPIGRGGLVHQAAPGLPSPHHGGQPSDIAAQAPSSTMIMKQSSSLLRAIGLSAGLVASAAMMPSVHAATSATITATGTVPVACSVNGATIAMAKIDAYSLFGQTPNVAYTTGSATIFSLSTPTLNAPSGYGGTAYISLLKDYQIMASADTNGVSNTYTVSGAESGVFTYDAGVNSANEALKPGVYTVSSTLTRVGQ
jgi:hypothetical protein